MFYIALLKNKIFFKYSICIILLIPAFRRIKEWAYAGLFFDLAGAFFSLIAVDGFKPELAFMLVFMGLLFGSYFLWHKKIGTGLSF